MSTKFFPRLPAWRGQPALVYAPIASADAVTYGDMVYLDATGIHAFSNLADVGTKAQNQAAAALVFLGVAMKSHAANSGAALLPVAVDGEFEFDCTSATYEIGDLVGPSGTGAGAAVGLANQSVEAVATQTLATARVAKRVAVAATRVRVKIMSALMAGIDRTGLGRVPTLALSADGAITIPLYSQVLPITKGTAAALTIADPTSGTHDGVQLTFVSTTAAAHTVSNAAGSGFFSSGGSSKDVATFGGAIGDGFSIIAYGGKWYIDPRGVTNVTLG
jgi:hypothetical protein